MKTQPHLPDDHLPDDHLPEEKTQDGAAKSKLLARIKKVGGKSILQHHDVQTTPGIQSKEIFPNESLDKIEANDGNKNKHKSPIGTPKFQSKEVTDDTVFEDEFKNIKTLPRLKRLSRGKIPRKKPMTKSLLVENVQSKNKDNSRSIKSQSRSNVHSLSNENEIRKSQDGQTAHQDKELGDDETSPSVAALDNSGDENSDSAMDDSGEDDDDGMTPEARDENKENLKKMLHKHIKEDDESEKSETDSVQGDSENEDVEETGDEQNAFKETDTNLNERIRPKTNVKKSKDLIPASSQDNKKDHSNLVKTQSLNKAMRQKRSSKEENVTNSDHHLHTTKTQKNHEAFKTQRKIGEKEDLVIEQDDSNNVEDDLENGENPTESEVNDNDATNSDTSEMDEDGSENDSFQNNNSKHDVTDSDENGTEKEADAMEDNDSLIQKVDENVPENYEDAIESDQILEDKSSGTSQRKDTESFKVPPRAKKKNKKHSVDDPVLNLDSTESNSNNNPHTVINIEADHQGDNSESESELPFHRLEASSDFYNKYGYHRRDRPSLVPVSSDDDEMSQSYQDYLKFIKSQERKPRQISDYPNFNRNLVTIQPEKIQDIIPVVPSRPFTILAITNGKLDLDVDEVVIDIDDEGEKEKTAVPPDSVGTAVDKADDTTLGVLSMIQRKKKELCFKSILFLPINLQLKSHVPLSLIISCQISDSSVMSVNYSINVARYYRSSHVMCHHWQYRPGMPNPCQHNMTL
ncbi:hypothetical protein Btru_005202 [Bulinus truncatus]|nr:hypothetical protein Btru_005202 [Bulinus truncatus]